MAEKGYLFTAPGAGDGATEYTQTDWQRVMQVTKPDGVTRGWRNQLAPSSTGANNARIGTGGAYVDGKPYDNTSNVDVTIPSAVGGGNTRIDRIVLRANWAAGTIRVFRIAGVDAATPTAPAITTTSGTTYDIPLCQVLVNTSGAITITDERTWSDAAANSVPRSGLSQGAATSVIGRAANSIGDIADIVASANDRILARVSNALSWVQLTIGMIPDALITEAKLAAAAAAKLVTNGNSHDHNGGDGAQIPTGGLADNSVTTAKILDGNVSQAKLADTSVSQAKLATGASKVSTRRGGSATDWATPGTNSYTPTSVDIQMGAQASDGSGNVTVSFPFTFTGVPVIFREYSSALNLHLYTSALSASGVTINVRDHSNNPASGVTVFWLAVGPR